MDKKATYEELLQKDDPVKVHHWNLQCIATKIMKVIGDLAPNIKTEAWWFRESSYNLRFEMNSFMIWKEKSTYHRLKFVLYLTPRMWE